MKVSILIWESNVSHALYSFRTHLTCEISESGDSIESGDSLENGDGSAETFWIVNQ